MLFEKVLGCKVCLFIWYSSISPVVPKQQEQICLSFCQFDIVKTTGGGGGDHSLCKNLGSIRGFRELKSVTISSTLYVTSVGPGSLVGSPATNQSRLLKKIYGKCKKNMPNTTTNKMYVQQQRCTTVQNNSNDHRNICQWVLVLPRIPSVTHRKKNTAVLWWVSCGGHSHNRVFCCVIKFNDDCSKSIYFFSLNMLYLFFSCKVFFFITNPVC